MGGEREIRFLKEEDEGGQLIHVALFGSISYGYMVDELPNESVERNSQIFSNLIFLAII